MHIDFLIVGQGIAGTLLSFELLKRNRTVLVLDGPDSGSIASLVAGAVLNPRTGNNAQGITKHAACIKRALQTYDELGELTGHCFYRSLPMYRFCNAPPVQHEPAPEMQHPPAWRSNAFSRNGNRIIDEHMVHVVDAPLLLGTWRNYLEKGNSFREDHFNENLVQQSGEAVKFKDIIAKKVIFCRGAAERKHQLFAQLPFTANRGEALLLSVPALAPDAVYHAALRLVPRSDGLFWCGSNYRWQFSDLQPDAEWRANAESQLAAWLNIPFEVSDHIVAERPTTAGQFPLAGLHPQEPAYGIFNGLGTKGFSAGPGLSSLFADYLCGITPIIEDYDTTRFRSFFKR